MGQDRSCNLSDIRVLEGNDIQMPKVMQETKAGIACAAAKTI